MNDSREKDPYRTCADQAPAEHNPAADQPERIGRYRVKKVLGKGGFGIVYLGQDEQLQRLVAVKVPHGLSMDRPEDAETYLAEARTVAGLDHPNIVPVFDVGATPECPCFIVSKYIEGTTLAQRMRAGRLLVNEIVELVATVAESLHYAHRQGVIHRDVKPGNVLLDTAGRPYVADFGLALKEEQIGRGAKYAGTPAYMSPEQARGEGHRVDGRSDLFSLGVVLYELLTGKRPFKGDSLDELFDQITTLEPRPLRQLDDAIPKELERICLKTLVKRAAERHTTALDLADDLRHFLAGPGRDTQMTSTQRRADLPSAAPAVADTLNTPSDSAPATPTPTSSRQPIKIVPKGLRSFTRQDADFFLELLPGPRDRNGLPDSLRFWKTRIEETDPDSTFAIGLIYGPSGCGKSSLVKAGLLPRLADDVVVVYLEATPEDTETRLLNGLRKRCPSLPTNLNLKDSLATLRRGQGLRSGTKVLMVLDQFEQWLHARRGEQNTELVQALRQCDGGRVQCIVMVRDDFWLAVSRFLRDVEVRLVEGQNSALVDLFDLDHARKVLTAFGRAYGKLPEPAGALSKEQKEFLQQAVRGLAQEGKVISVRLALFAEMMKGKTWSPPTLKEMGGTTGVGVTFLEETFSATTAPPEHRYHQKAARAALQALLPESGTDIKGHMRSDAELLAASGYAGRRQDFEDLLRILDGELRLITPTDPDGQEGAEPAAPGQRYYQLTHDYLVHSLRDWLTRKQKETRRGRAELLLADQASAWIARPENRNLPPLWPWLALQALTERRHWTPPQRHMMRQAGRYHAVRGLVLAGLLALIGLGAYEAQGTLTARALRDRLLDASTSEVPAIIRDMTPYRRWLDPLLRTAFIQAGQEPRRQLHTSLALFPVDPAQKEYLTARLLDAEPHEIAVLRDALASCRAELVETLWSVVGRPRQGREPQRLRAACALAAYDGQSARWATARDKIASDLVSVPPVHLAIWMDALRPVGGSLQPALAAIYRNGKRRETERSLATDILAEYAADQPGLLSDLLLDADEKQFAVLYPKLRAHGVVGLSGLFEEIDKPCPPDAGQAARDSLARRRANAAVALVRLDRAEKVWPLLQHGPDPRTRSYLLHRLGPVGADAAAVVRRLGEEPDVTSQRALILSLGGFEDKDFVAAERDAATERIREIYRNADDPGLHAAAEWLLRHWQQDAWLKQTEQAWAKDPEQRAQRLERLRHELSAGKGAARPHWYVNGQGQTLVVIPGPVEFRMGSPDDEAKRVENERLHSRRISRTFAIAAKPVTVEQFLRFHPTYDPLPRYAPTPDCPILSVTWYQAAEYCNWLSAREGLPEKEWCYAPDKTGKYGEGMRLVPDYLQCSGYRLPTEAEWEFACRAGAVTSRYYGESDDLLGKYGWYQSTAFERTWPVGSLKPNDFGLFDMHGNVWTWCQDRYRDYPLAADGRPVEDRPDESDGKSGDHRVLRGGSYISNAVPLRCAFRYHDVPGHRIFNFGLRPARTFPVD